MLSAVWHEQPSGARFVFNCYWAVLLLRSNHGHTIFIFSKEAVTQQEGDPLSMFAYGIGMMPLIHQLKAKFPQVEQPCYVDDAGAGQKLDEIERFIWRLCKIGPLFGYCPEPTKSIPIVQQHNLEAA
jgi:hypothetical protein